MKLSILLLLSVVLTGCITTNTQESKKWEPEDRARVQVDLGMNYLKLNNYDVARESFENALRIYPRYDRAHHAMGLLYAQTQKTELAMQSFDKAVRINPKNYIAVNDYGTYLCHNGRIDEGLEQLKRVQSSPANDVLTTTFLGLGLCYHARRSDEFAKQFLRKSLETAPQLAQALLPLAEIYFREQDLLRARGFIERFFATGSINSRSLWLAARIEMQLGDRGTAELYITELRKRYPGSPLIIEARKLLKGS